MSGEFRAAKLSLGIILQGLRSIPLGLSVQKRLRQAMTRWKETTGLPGMQKEHSPGDLVFQLERLNALRQIDLAICSSFDAPAILGVILEQVTRHLQIDAADILLLNPRTRILECAAGRGFRTQALQHTRLPLGEGHAGRAALEQRLITVNNLQIDAGDLTRPPRLKEEEFLTYYAIPLVAKGQIKGTMELFHRSSHQSSPEWMDSLHALSTQAAIAIDNASLLSELQQSNDELARAYDGTIEGWSRALDLRDKETEGHTQRVVQAALQLARMLGIPEGAWRFIRWGALLHDIGKVGIPDSILLKPGPLDDQEWEIMRQHPTFAYRLLSPIDFLGAAIEIPYCHHEKWDGTGYPRGLAGEEIPLAARIFAIVDVWDALCSDRPYRRAWTFEHAHAYLIEQSGKHFEPRVAEAFLHLLDQKLLISLQAPEGLVFGLAADSHE